MSIAFGSSFIKRSITLFVPLNFLRPVICYGTISLSAGYSYRAEIHQKPYGVLKWINL